MKVTALMLVKNEENFIWFSINSIIDHVDEILVWDNGSYDNTVRIIETIENPKIKFKKNIQGDVTTLRQQMLTETNADWLFIHDGDEIWHKENLKNQIQIIKGQSTKFDVVVNQNKVLIGDMYHYLPESAGKYKIHDRVGHLNIRFIKNTPGLKVQGTYPYEAYVTEQDIPVQNFPRQRILFSSLDYLHASFLKRSNSDNRKTKYEIGQELPLDYYFPEIFFENRPKSVPCPWESMDSRYKIKAMVQTPFKRLKRVLL